MTKQKDIILNNDDQTTVNYVLFILDKVFGMDKSQATEIAYSVDRLGSALVYTSTPAEVDEKLEMINMYNEASSNNLSFTQQDHGLYQQPQAPVIKTQGASLTMRFANFAPEMTEIFHELGVIVRAANLPISKSEGEDLTEDLAAGREILLRDFGDDPKGQAKAEMLRELVLSATGFDGSNPDWEQREIDNVVFSIRPAGYILEGARNIISEQAAADGVFLDGIGDLGDMIGDLYTQQLLEKYGSIEEFLQTGSQQEVDEYNQIQAGLSELEGLVDTKKSKLSP